MAPEGFYGFGADGLKPDSKYWRSTSATPNTLDRALGRTGDFYHGPRPMRQRRLLRDDQRSDGEIYALCARRSTAARSAFPCTFFRSA